MAARMKLGQNGGGSGDSLGARSGPRRVPGRSSRFSRLPVRCGPLFRAAAGGPLKLPTNGSARVSRCLLPVGAPKRSLSMTDLTSRPGRAWFGATPHSGNGARELEEERSAGERRSARCSKGLEAAAASRIRQVLVVNAWRRRRDEVHELRGKIERYDQQQEHLHLRIVVLRRLLESENHRVGRITGEMHRIKMRLDEAVRQRDGLRTEKEEAEGEASRLLRVAEERSVEAENTRNELASVRSQLEALDRQIGRDREKLEKLREDRRILLDKVSASEALATERGVRAERAESAIQEVRRRLAEQIALHDSCQERNRRLSKKMEAKETEMGLLRRQLCESEGREKASSSLARTLQSQLAERDVELGRLRAAYDSQTLELEELREAREAREARERQVAPAGGWSARMLYLAGSVARAPRLILRTLSLLSTANIPLPP